MGIRVGFPGSGARNFGFRKFKLEFLKSENTAEKEQEILAAVKEQCADIESIPRRCPGEMMSILSILPAASKGWIYSRMIRPLHS